MRFLITTLLTVCLLCVSTSMLVAQRNLSLYHMSYVPQSTYTNPSAIPLFKGHLGLPVLSNVHLRAGNSAFTYNQIVNELNTGDLTVNLNRLSDLLKDDNFFLTDLETDWLSLSFHIGKKAFIYANISDKFNFQLQYPKELLQIFLAAGDSNLQESFDLRGLDWSVAHYREYGLGYAQQIGNRLTVGGKLKYLQGFLNLGIGENSLVVDLNERDHLFRARGGFELLFTGPPSLIDDQDIDEFATYFFNTSNTGLAFDIGATYQLTNKLHLSASIIDIGGITWKDQITRLNANADFAFTNLNLDEIVNVDSINGLDDLPTLEDFGDALNNAFVRTEEGESYYQNLTTRLNIGARFHLNSTHSFGFLSQTAFLENKARSSFSLSYNLNVKKIVGFTLTYSIFNNSATNLGLGSYLNLGPVQFYSVTDNVLANFSQGGTKNANFRIGMNILFGKQERELAARKNDRQQDMTDRLSQAVLAPKTVVEKSEIKQSKNNLTEIAIGKDEEIVLRHPFIVKRIPNPVRKENNKK